MSVLQGGLLDTGFVLYGDTGLTPNIDSGLPVDFPTEINNYFSNQSDSGPLSNVAAPVDIIPNDNYQGAIIPNFGTDVFFDRIHVLPNVIDVGNLANNQTRTIEIFNAFIQESATLNAYSPNGLLSGVQFNIDNLPVQFFPLSSHFYQLKINTTGSPNFDGFYDFDFGEKSAPPLSVKGRRIIIFPFKHNWVQLPTETLEFLTQIYESRSDLESSQKLRPYPRRKLKYYHTPIESGELKYIAESKAEMEAIIYLWMHRIFALPIWEDFSVLVGTLNLGSLSVPMPTTGLDYDSGSYIVFWKSASKFELVEIDTVSQNSISLIRATQNEWGPGTLILPARLARLASMPQFKGDTEDILQFETEWALEPNQKSIKRIGTYTAPVYRNFPVYMPTYINDGEYSTSLKRKQVEIDYGTGMKSVASLGKNPRGNFPALHLNLSRLEASKFYGFINDRSGRLNPCWFPSWARDFTISEVISNNSSSLIVKGNRFSNIYGGDYQNFGFNRRDLMIRWTDGTILFARVMNAAIIDDETEVLQIDKTFPKEMQVNQLDRISFLKFARFESDNIEIVKETGNISHSELSLMELVAAE